MENSRVVICSLLTMGWVVMWSSVVVGALRYTVGGSKNWNPNVNYTEWAANVHVHVGDWLLFNFDKRYYNVLEVNKTSYENCIDRDFIKNVTRGGRDVVQLTESKTYYFLSGGGYCYHGMKVAVFVEDAPAPAPAPAGNSGSAPSMYDGSDKKILASVMLFLGLALRGIL